MRTKIVVASIITMFIIGLLPIALNPRAMAHTAADPFVTDLIASQTIDVGDVLVWNDATHLFVKYMTTGDWTLNETHLHVATSKNGIPHTGSGNPIPGQFQYSASHSSGTTEFTYMIPLSWSDGTQLYIAAHAVVCTPGEADPLPAEGVFATVTLWTFPSMMDAGSVTVAIVGDNLVVTFQTTGSWQLLDTHLYASTVPPGFPPPWWNFPYKHIGLGGVTTDSYTIPLSVLGVGPGDTLYISAHAWMSGLDGQGNPMLTDAYADMNPAGGWTKYFWVTIPSRPPPPPECETAWGKGTRFVRSTWAMYFTYTVQ